MIIYLHGFNSSSSSSKAQLCKKYLDDKGIGDKILIPDLPLSTDKVVSLIEKLISENEIIGFIGSSMGGFYSCYFANKYNMKGVYINPVVDDHLASMLNIVGSYKNFNNGKKDTFSIDDYESLKKYSTPVLAFPMNHFLLAQEGDEVLDQRLSLTKFKDSKISFSKLGNHQFLGFENKIEQIFDFLF